jgi:hypothetical protein
MQREYMLGITVNSRKLNRVLIDSHYEVKHADLGLGEKIERRNI